MPRDNTSPRDLGNDRPITIVGAGPAGLACAIVLARGGKRVVVREAHARAGMRFHDDFQGIENWSSELDVFGEWAQHGVTPDCEYHPVREGMAFDDRGDRYRVASREPIFYLVRRGSAEGTLDCGLLVQARDLGVEVRFNDRVKHVQGAAVLAGGPRVADAIAAGYVFETDMPDGNWVAFDESLAPGGYAYLLIHRGRGTVASCIYRGFKREAEYVSCTVDVFRRRVGLQMRNPRPFGGFANFRLPRRAMQGGHLVIGEQAGFQDALAGFGMRFAVKSGILAARSLVDGTDYVSAWRRELLPLMRASVSNRLLFELAGDAGTRKVLTQRLSRGDTRDAVRRIYQPSWLSRLLFAPAYWRYRRRLRDPSCDHMGCSCVWCRCAEQESAPEDALNRKEN